LLGATVPFRPSADGGTITGKPTVDATAIAVRFRKERLVTRKLDNVSTPLSITVALERPDASRIAG